MGDEKWEKFHAFLNELSPALALHFLARDDSKLFSETLENLQYEEEILKKILKLFLQAIENPEDQ